MICMYEIAQQIYNLKTLKFGLLAYEERRPHRLCQPIGLL